MIYFVFLVLIAFNAFAQGPDQFPGTPVRGVGGLELTPTPHTRTRRSTGSESETKRPCQRALFGENAVCPPPLVSPSTPMPATRPLWGRMAARAAAAAAIADQAPALLPEDDIDTETAQAEAEARIEEQEQEFLAYEEAVNAEQEQAEDAAREEERRYQWACAVRELNRRLTTVAPCRFESTDYRFGFR